MSDPWVKSRSSNSEIPTELPHVPMKNCFVESYKISIDESFQIISRTQIFDLSKRCRWINERLWRAWWRFQPINFSCLNFIRLKEAFLTAIWDIFGIWERDLGTGEIHSKRCFPRFPVFGFFVVRYAHKGLPTRLICFEWNESFRFSI